MFGINGLVDLNAPSPYSGENGANAKIAPIYRKIKILAGTLTMSICLNLSFLVISAKAGALPICEVTFTSEIRTQDYTSLSKARQTVLYRSSNSIIRVSRILKKRFTDNNAIYNSVFLDLMRRSGQRRNLVVLDRLYHNPAPGFLAYVAESLDLPGQLEFTIFCESKSDIVFFRGSNDIIGIFDQRLQTIKEKIAPYVRVSRSINAELLE